MRTTIFICRKCNRSTPTIDKKGNYKEWQWCCGDAMHMGVIIGKIVPKGTQGQRLKSVLEENKNE